ncbi:MAG TPA: HAD-IB family phosphatase [Patescibacteria group bacterium]|nr:HAD-IB family phosphatase [Patescibacteria group bacterium]
MNEVIPAGLVHANADKLAQKIEDFRQTGPDQLQIVFDFDRTLTVAKPGTNDEVTTWHILNEHLPQGGQDRYQELFRHYRALEVSGEMTSNHAIEWWSSILDLFVEHNVDMSEVAQDFLSKANIRPDAKELFALCAEHGIPTIILSAGIKDVIELWAQTYSINPSIILSTSLITDENKRVVGWDKQTLVHVLNKKEVGHPELTRIRSERRNVILIGDSLADADMAEGTATVLRIRLYDPRADEQVAASIREQTLQVFDAMIENGTLEPARRLAQYIIGIS